MSQILETDLSCYKPELISRTAIMVIYNPPAELKMYRNRFISLPRKYAFEAKPPQQGLKFIPGIIPLPCCFEIISQQHPQRCFIHSIWCQSSHFPVWHWSQKCARVTNWRAPRWRVMQFCFSPEAKTRRMVLAKASHFCDERIHVSSIIFPSRNFSNYATAVVAAMRRRIVLFLSFRLPPPPVPKSRAKCWQLKCVSRSVQTLSWEECKDARKCCPDWDSCNLVLSWDRIFFGWLLAAAAAGLEAGWCFTWHSPVIDGMLRHFSVARGQVFQHHHREAVVVVFSGVVWNVNIYGAKCELNS